MESSNPTHLASIWSQSDANSSRACASCSRAKVKCVVEQEKGKKCQRCHRLKRPCQPSTAQDRHARKRRPKPTTNVPTSHVEKLEEKLDSLVSLIKSTQDPKFHGVVSNQQLSPSGFTGSTPPAHFSELSTSPPSMPELQPRQSIVSQNSDADLAPSIPSFVEANELLHVFREQMLPKFPFIVLPQVVSAEELHMTRPFLYLSMLAVTVRNSAQQTELGKLVITQLAERMFVNGERSLDLLLGIVTYSGWCYQHLWNFPQLTSLLSAGLTLIYDLGLHKSLPNSSTRNPWEEALRDMCLITYSPARIVRTLEERRAFLGFYFLSSVCTTLCRKVEFFQIYSPYIEECVKTLEQSGDDPNDTPALMLVKQQVLLERIHQCSWNSRTEPREVNASTMFILSALEQDLKQVRQKIPLQQTENAFIYLHYHVTEISLYEAAICKSRSGTDVLPNFTRLKLLCNCLEACKSYFQVFFSILPSDYPNMPMPTWPTVKYSITNLLALSTFEHPGWDLAQVRDTIDFVATMSRAVEMLESVSSVPGSEKIDVYSRTAKMMSRVSIFLREKIFSQAQAAAGGADQMEGFEPVPCAEDLSQFFHFLDDTLMGDVMGFFDYEYNPNFVN